jgi:UDP-glucose 4-epimerase
MAILVTGGAGYIGSHMVLELLDAGEKPIVLDDLSTGFRWAVPEGVPFIQGTCGDQALVSRIIRDYGVTDIIHFAAKIIVADSVSEPLDYYESNASQTRNLIECAIAGGVKNFIFSSTAAVYGEPKANPVTEGEPLEPVSPYGRSKLICEWMIEDAARAHGLHYVILRYFNVAGADPKGRAGESCTVATHLVKLAAQAALGIRPALEIFGTDYPTPDGTCLRDYIQVTDLARAHLMGLTHLRKGGDNLTCNCGYERAYSVREVIETMKSVSGVNFPVRLSARRPGDPAAIVAGNKRVREKLGWQPLFDDLSKITQQALDWERRLHNRNINKAD